jgi:hypothetical protein
MRKSILFLTMSVVAITVFSFTSCKKKDGVFNPKEKLHKVYSQRSVLYGSTGATESSDKVLSEIWRWNKNKLIQVESGYGWSYYFTYDGNQVSKIEIGDEQVINFSYDKAKLKTMEVLDSKGRSTLILTIVDRNGEHITKYTMETFSYSDESKANRQLLSEQLQPIMQLMFFDNMPTFVCENVTQTKTHKATTSNISTYELMYDGNNIKEQKISTSMGDSTKTETIVFEYDSKKNPYYNALHMIGYDIGGQTENNVTKYYNMKNHDDVTIYKYEYKGDYPTKRIHTYEYQLLEHKNTITTTLHYEYIEK